VKAKEFWAAISRNVRYFEGISPATREFTQRRETWRGQLKKISYHPVPMCEFPNYR
jgi:hypothetical protein